MLHRRLLLTLPAVATLLVIVVLLGPGQPRAVMGVRALGVIEPDYSVWSVRLLAVRSDGGREDALGGRRLSLFVDGEPAWEGSTSETGVAEVAFPHPISGGSRLRVVDEEAGVVLDDFLSGERKLRPGALGWLAGRKTGDITVAARLVAGPVVPPFPTRVRVFAGEDLFDGLVMDESRLLDGKVEVTIHGGEPARTELEVGPGAPSEIEIQPIFEPLEIDLAFRSADGRTGALAATIPIVMGGFRARDGAELEISSQAPRPHAYVSFFSGNARLGGAVISLSEAPDGLFKGVTARPRTADAVVVASDPSERGLSTVTWPLSSQAGTPHTFELGELGNGLPMTTGLERMRLRRVRLATVGMLGLAALAEIVLLLIVGRTRRLASERVLPEENAEGAPDASRDGPLRIAKNAGTTILIAVAMALLLLLAFAGIAGVAVLR